MLRLLQKHRQLVDERGKLMFLYTYPWHCKISDFTVLLNRIRALASLLCACLIRETTSCGCKSSPFTTIWVVVLRKTVMMMLAQLVTAKAESELTASGSRAILLLDFRKAYDTVLREFLFSDSSALNSLTILQRCLP